MSWIGPRAFNRDGVPQDRLLVVGPHYSPLCGTCFALTDALTGIHNKLYLYRELEREIDSSRHEGREVAVVLCNIDHFLRLNDAHGHLAGDFVLRELARVMTARLQIGQVLARVGGDAFALLLPETSLDGAVALAEDLRREAGEHAFVFQADSIRMTFSAGVARVQDGDRTAREVMARAEEALFSAKNAGRDRVCR